ncbi:MAG: DNA-binding protein [Thiotrichaceae bacterium IS1]|nr:MAG: DNA-binding protein [Thiotrichaceae bacterium IS1]
MKPTVYIETSIISYLTARLSNDLIVAARQKLTIDWWENRRPQFELYTSEVVLQEARRGDPQAANNRLQMLQNVPQLDLMPETLELVELFLAQHAIPLTAREDAIHIAIAVTYGLDYLLTWNCRHIANAEIQKQLAKLSSAAGYDLPILCTPELLMGE